MFASTKDNGDKPARINRRQTRGPSEASTDVDAAAKDKGTTGTGTTAKGTDGKDDPKPASSVGTGAIVAAGPVPAHVTKGRNTWTSFVPRIRSWSKTWNAFCTEPAERPVSEIACDPFAVEPVTVWRSCHADRDAPLDVRVACRLPARG